MITIQIVAQFSSRLSRYTHSSLKGNQCGKPPPKWMSKCLKPDTQNTLPYGNASRVGEYPGTSGRMLSESVGACSGIRTGHEGHDAGNQIGRVKQIADQNQIDGRK
jgi:hypothetical protein